jgi:hypothetical protein
MRVFKYLTQDTQNFMIFGAINRKAPYTRKSQYGADRYFGYFFFFMMTMTIPAASTAETIIRI